MNQNILNPSDNQDQGFFDIEIT